MRRTISGYNDTASTPGDPRTLDERYEQCPNNTTIEMCASFCSDFEHFVVKFGFKWHVFFPKAALL